MVRLLLRSNAATNIRNNNQQRPSQMSRDNDTKQLIQKVEQKTTSAKGGHKGQGQTSSDIALDDTTDDDAYSAGMRRLNSKTMCVLVCVLFG